MTDSAPRSVAPPKNKSRLDVIDWLRGFAVVLMIQAHGFDSWLAPSAKSGPAYEVIRLLSGLPSRLFLFLVGVSVAIRFENQIKKGISGVELRRPVARRGMEILGMAYLFRLQEYTLAGFKGGWESLFRVDILNCIGMSLLVLALVAVPQRGRPAFFRCLGAAALLVGLGPIVGPIRLPDWLPRALTSYIGGQRPMSWFALFPWGAWALVGTVVGHLWVRLSATPRGQSRAFLLSGICGLAITLAVVGVRRLDPQIIRYPSDLVQQMGPGAFFYRLGLVGIVASLAWLMNRLAVGRFSPMRQLGQTSLLIYWIHVDICYGGITRFLRGRQEIPGAALAIALLTAAMVGVSWLKTRHFARLSSSLRGWWMHHRAAARPVP